MLLLLLLLMIMMMAMMMMMTCDRFTDTDIVLAHQTINHSTGYHLTSFDRSFNSFRANFGLNTIGSRIKQAVRLGGRHNMPPPRDFDF